MYYFSEPSLNKSGGSSVHIRYSASLNTNDIEKWKFHKIRYNTDISKILSVDSGRNSIHVHVKDDGFLCNFKNVILQTALHNNIKWFGKNINAAEISRLFHSKDTTVLKAKNTYNLFDEHGNHIDSSNIKKGRYVRLNIECTGLYFISKEFGISWKILSAVVYPDDRLDTYAFESDFDDVSDAEPV